MVYGSVLVIFLMEAYTLANVHMLSTQSLVEKTANLEN